MKVFVLEFDRLNKAYVVDHKTLNVYETEKIDNNMHYIKDHKRGDLLSICCTIVSMYWFNIMNILFNLIGLSPNTFIYYLTLMIYVFFYTKLLSPYLRVEVDSTNLKILSKTSHNMLIRNMTKNAQSWYNNEYKAFLVVFILEIIFIWIVLIVKDFSYNHLALTVFIFCLSSMFHNREITRRQTLKRLLAELEQM